MTKDDWKRFLKIQEEMIEELTQKLKTEKTKSEREWMESNLEVIKKMREMCKQKIKQAEKKEKKKYPRDKVIF